AQPSPAIVLQPEYASPQEVIGAISKELIKSGKCITFNEIQLMLIVRLKLATEPSQQSVLRDALMLITHQPLY
ncbi:MAG: biofilm development regulator YmgB/AriR family protein, partial [Pantoea sp.]|nr:biofilm development regulator YmgB/AriR family protein [Pantoea sp.]